MLDGRNWNKSHKDIRGIQSEGGATYRKSLGVRVGDSNGDTLSARRLRSSRQNARVLVDREPARRTNQLPLERSDTSSAVGIQINRVQLIDWRNQVAWAREDRHSGHRDLAAG